jgi:hypothetical protein
MEKLPVVAASVIKFECSLVIASGVGSCLWKELTNFEWIHFG